VDAHLLFHIKRLDIHIAIADTSTTLELTYTDIFPRVLKA